MESLREVFSSGAQPFPDLTDAWIADGATSYAMTLALADDHGFQTYALDSFDAGLARAMIEFARQQEVPPPEVPLTLFEGFSHPGYAFDCLVMKGPSIHRYQKETPELQLRIRALAPAFRCEFTGDEGEEEANWRCNRAPGVPCTRWNRIPRPFLKMRVLTQSGREQSKRDFVQPLSLKVELGRLENRPEGFVEFENYQRLVRTVRWSEGWQIDSGPPMELEQLMDWCRSHLYGPNLGAGTGDFDRTSYSQPRPDRA